MKVALFGNSTKIHSGATVAAITSSLEKAGIDFIVENELLPLLPEHLQKSINGSRNECAAAADVIFSIGGDGTLLRSAVTAHSYNKPIAGINLGKLGFLAEVSVDAIDRFVSDLRNDKLRKEERLLLQLTAGGESFIAFNDFVIDKGGWPRMIELRLSVDGSFVSSVYADGLIVATPAGSTGYSLSTGGSVIIPSANVIALSAIAPHTMTMRPMIVPGNACISVTAASPSGKTNLIADGQTTIEYDTPVEFTVEKHPRPLHLLRFGEELYYETLRKKLLLGADTRLGGTTL